MFRYLVLGMLGMLAAMGCNKPDNVSTRADSPKPVVMLVCDPLCNRMACDCVKGYAQRNYEDLAASLRQATGKAITVAYSPSLAEYLMKYPAPALVVGKASWVQANASKAGIPIRGLAALSGQDGLTTTHGLFVVRSDSGINTMQDLAGKRLSFGPAYETEKNAAALDALQAAGVPVTGELHTTPACSVGALEVAEKKADCAVISSYAMPLLEGCGSIHKGELKIIGETRPVAFITVFALPGLKSTDADAIQAALLKVGQDKTLCTTLETRDGFVALPAQAAGDNR